MATAKFYRLLYYLVKQKYYKWEVLDFNTSELIKETKIKITQINKKSLRFEGKELSQDITIPIKEVCDLEYDEQENSYSFYLESNPIFKHKLTSIFF